MSRGSVKNKPRLSGEPARKRIPLTWAEASTCRPNSSRIIKGLFSAKRYQRQADSEYLIRGTFKYYGRIGILPLRRRCGASNRKVLEGLTVSRQAVRVHGEKFYDEYWKSGQHCFGEWDEQSFCRLLSPLTGLDCVLDYGCGYGCFYRRRLSGAVKTYVGADVAEAALATLRQGGFSALIINPETGAINCADNRFDGAACIEVFEHLFDPLRAAREINRVLKPGGVLVASVPNFGYFAWRLLALLRAQVPLEPHSNRYDGVHIRFFSKLMFTRLLRDGGFVDIKIGSWDNASVWDVFQAMGPFGTISQYARRHLPKFMHLEFLQDAWPNVFAVRLRAVARKPR